MLWLLFPLMGAVAIAVGVALPVQAALGYVAVIGWAALLIYLVFYRDEAVSQALERLSKKENKV